MRGEISARPISKNGNRTAAPTWSSISELSEDPDFLAIAGFSVIGLLIALYLAMHFPFTDAMMELLGQFGQFP